MYIFYGHFFIFLTKQWEEARQTTAWPTHAQQPWGVAKGPQQSYNIDSSPREPRFVLVPRAGLGKPWSASNANKLASSWPLKQGSTKWSKHGCDKGTICGPWPFCFKFPVFVFFPTTIPMLHHSVALEVALLELPTSFCRPQHTPVIGLLIGVWLGVCVCRSSCTLFGPAGSLMCTDLTQTLHHA